MCVCVFVCVCVSVCVCVCVCVCESPPATRREKPTQLEKKATPPFWP